MSAGSWIVDRFELSRGGSAHNVRPMEGMRGFAVFLVFLVHYVTLIQPWVDKDSALAGFADAMHTMGNAGVDLFFVLSGFLIYGSLIGRRQAFLPFMRKRVARIYPAFLVVFVIYFALSMAMPAESKIPRSGSEAVLYVLQNYLLLPGLFPIEPMITVAWSLSYEMFYYMVVPPTILLFGLRAKSSVWRVWFFASLAAAIAAYCAVNGGHVRLIMFIAGILLHEALSGQAIVAPRSGFALLALLAGLIATLLPFFGPTANTFKVIILFASFFMLCFSSFGIPGAWIARAFSVTPLRWLGNMSYSYYLLHGLALKVAFMVLFMLVPHVDNHALFFGTMIPVMFFVTLIPSAALFLAVERRFSLAQAVATVRGSRGAGLQPRLVPMPPDVEVPEIAEDVADSTQAEPRAQVT